VAEGSSEELRRFLRLYHGLGFRQIVDGYHLTLRGGQVGKLDAHNRIRQPAGNVPQDTGAVFHRQRQYLGLLAKLDVTGLEGPARLGGIFHQEVDETFASNGLATHPINVHSCPSKRLAQLRQFAWMVF
jgi:hypothetical protein